MHRHDELRRPPSDVVVQAPAPAMLVTGGTLVEGSDIAMRWHTGSLTDDLATQARADHDG